tara:strand:+ start:6517 stop:6666 length:150 start_codon:yes stop_codon:yes gene_type:complete
MGDYQGSTGGLPGGPYPARRVSEVKDYDRENISRKYLGGYRAGNYRTYS